jgi:thiamine pyrophosphate-dependent acetolactate synthase large subunit-like protein
MTDTLWGSDAVAAILRKLDVKYAALVPGASYRGLHDSIVNYTGNENPQMLMCLHEEAAVALAHGYAKVTNRPMVAIVHSNVGLMHATMAIFNAYADRVPVLVLGANGPVDAAKRRPWIDWIHTTLDMGAQVRDYTKWDDAPGSPAAAVESILRAWQIASAAPPGPTFVVLDAAWQEQQLDALPRIPDDVVKFAPPAAPGAAPADLERVLTLLRGARRPLVLCGRSSRSLASWNARVALAEALSAQVVTHQRAGAVFPTEHPLHAGHTAAKPALEAIRQADVILDLDAIDLAGILREACGAEVGATVISASLDRYVHKAWVADYQQLPALDLNLAVSPEVLVAQLVEALGARAAAPAHRNGSASSAAPAPGEPFTMSAFSSAIGRAFAGEERCFVRVARGVKAADMPLRHPLDALGQDGGGGVGSGCGLAVGAALALRDSGRLPVAILGDGDFLMGVTALWTAVANKIPLLVIVANNHSFYNDEVHQERVAIRRGRDPKRKWIGQRIDDPAPDCAKLAEAQGAVGIGPVTDAAAFAAALTEAVRQVRAGRVCVIDAVIVPDAAATAEVPASVMDRAER